MKIILTHEQADFDALASLLGAHLLDEAQIPVLPRRMNRNVRAFLTIYGVDLPFVEHPDLPSDAVESITLVDTQSLVSVRGVSDTTKIRIIDHHPLRDDLPQDWVITVSGTGANTTFFAEILRERDITLSMVQATLLLLGIYEDTGSLTYDRTTARDLRAASYLLEQGASLQLAGDFLNHPLSLAQQAIYEQLRSNIETMSVHGHTILLSRADAGQGDDELSTIAHKLRDLLDPDALCILVKTRSGIQLIARSTSHNIDVGQLAQFFGGGGHERASASLIKDRDLSDVYHEVQTVIQRFVHPSVSVAQIMSSNPQLLSPGMAVHEASVRMQRFGYEGFPVVSDGKLVGLLTRRAVDRAIGHKLNEPISKLLDVGQFTIHPDDSIEALQRVMAESGWGQIPVVDEQGKIIGIVTRTDLIKVMTPRQPLPSHKNLVDKLERALPVERLALLKAVAHIASQQHTAIYIVGGFVRDLLLDRPSIDFDIVVEGDAIALGKALVNRFGGRLVSHSRFSTAKWFPAVEANAIHTNSLNEPVDLVSARTEFYTHPSALPTVERGSIKLDLHRRDFTINTLALRLDGRHYGELYDHWGGLTDLNRGIVRVLHSLSFVDDSTRILRAIRFEQRFAFKIDVRTLELLIEAIPLLDRVSGDRIRHELDNILNEPKFNQILARLAELGLLAAIDPFLRYDHWERERLDHLTSRVPEPFWDFSAHFSTSYERRAVIYCLLFLRFPEGRLAATIKRIKLSSALSRIINQAYELWGNRNTIKHGKPSEVVDLLDGYSPIAVYAVMIANEDAEISSQIVQYMQTWRMIQPTIDGNALRQRGVIPGPVYREILKCLRDAWVNGTVSNQQQEAALIEKLIAKKLA